MDDPDEGGTGMKARDLLNLLLKAVPRGLLHDYLLMGRYLLPYWRGLTLFTALAIVCAFFEAVSLSALVPLVQMMESPEEPGGTLWGILEGMFAAVGIELTFTTLLALITVIFLLGQVLLYVKKQLQVNLRVDFTRTLKVRAFQDILSADISYHHNQKTGNFLNLLVTEIENAGYGLFAFTELLTDLFFITVYAAMLLYISVEITILILAISLVAFYFMNRWLRRSNLYGKRLVELNTEQNDFLSERFGLLRLIKTSSTEPAEVHHFGDISQRFRDGHADYGIAGTNIEVVFQSIIFIIAVAVLFVSIDILDLQVALIFLFLFVLVRISAPLRDVNTRRYELARQIPSFQKIDGVLAEARSHRMVKDGTRAFPGFRGEIRLEKVSFSYDGKNPVLREISLGIPRNRMVALVGSSGGGKSTIADLIIRLIDPDQGAVLIDGVDLREYTLGSYRRRLGVVSQDIYLFNDTVLANICYGSGEISPERAMEAARVANAHEFIEKLPGGYQAVLGERGAKLSGGQRQRIALARALYKDPEILILDEATSSLDSESEKIIQDSIREIKEQYTIIAIAHRLSTIEGADRIYIIEQGSVVEEGTHGELLAAGGPYAKYHGLQQGRNP
ncbi:MAG: ABC transporter ATP-binding protein/permease [Methanomicrobiales archaeon]|nr:ABC transporter ATP-binding protein/permease [Methanomicrobiales archaeon]